MPRKRSGRVESTSGASIRHYSDTSLLVIDPQGTTPANLSGLPIQGTTPALTGTTTLTQRIVLVLMVGSPMSKTV